MSSLRKHEEKRLAEKYEHFPTYKTCQSRALMSGVVAFMGGTLVTWAALAGTSKYISSTMFNRKTVALVPLITGVLGSYMVTKKMTRDCYSMWMVLEGKLDTFPTDEKDSKPV